MNRIQIGAEIVHKDAEQEVDNNIEQHRKA